MTLCMVPKSACFVHVHVTTAELQAPPYESSPPTGRPHGLHSRKGYQALPQEEEEEHVEPQEAQPELVPQSGISYSYTRSSSELLHM